ncbi:6-bladed beta-propeller [Parabacteroides bouchesdurhonensis]|uniref:6-bladed beta-propeller n=1 Tax=Parabacteroides bouchesdurhonensis TaxID=1936995 RepID=UPI000C81B62E|nr:6-bladed beta-propeller [Parabacteroides bouchesdurhonensis]
MRNVLFLSVLMINLLGLTGCLNRSGKVSERAIPVMNMDVSYPQKEFALQDLGKVRYIRMDTTENALLDDGMRLSPSANGFIFYNPFSGSVVGYDKDGHLICNFNHKGQGANEYANINKLAYDEENGKIYILPYGTKVNILAFDLQGKCVQSFSTPDTLIATDMALFNSESLLVWDTKNFNVIKEGKISKLAEALPDPNPYPFVFLNTKDGALDSRLSKAYPEHFRLLVFTIQDGAPFVMMAHTNTIVPSNNGFLLNDFVSDTVFWLSKDKEVKPVFTHTPSLHTNIPKRNVCEVWAMSSRFMLINVISLNLEEASTQTGLKTAWYLWDSNEQSFTQCTFYNADFKKAGETLRPTAVSGDKLYFRYFPSELLEASEKQSLKGELETLTHSLDEDDNMILMEVSLSD